MHLVGNVDNWFDCTIWCIWSEAHIEGKTYVLSLCGEITSILIGQITQIGFAVYQSITMQEKNITKLIIFCSKP